MISPLKKVFSRKTKILLAFIFLSSTVNAFGAAVEMTSGRIIEGEIVERTDELIRIDTGFGIPVTYFLDEIKTIDGEAAVPVKEMEVPQPSEVPKAETPEVPGEPVTFEAPKAVEDVERMEPPETPRIENVPPVIEQVQKTETVELPSAVPITGQQEKTGEEKQESSSKDVATLEGIELFKEQPSPAAIKPKEAPPQKKTPDVSKRREQKIIAEVDKHLGIAPSTTDQTEPKANLVKTVLNKTGEYFRSHWSDLKDTGEYIRNKMPFLKERLYAIPVKVRRDALILATSVLAVLYIFVCFPLMLIARKLERRLSGLIWVPFAQVVYLVYMAKQPLWLAVLFFVPVVNMFLPLVLFFDILKLLKKPRWLIIFIIIPGLNIFTLWYLAISKANQPLGLTI